MILHGCRKRCAVFLYLALLLSSLYFVLWTVQCQYECALWSEGGLRKGPTNFEIWHDCQSTQCCSWQNTREWKSHFAKQISPSRKLPFTPRIYVYTLCHTRWLNLNLQKKKFSPIVRSRDYLGTLGIELNKFSSVRCKAASPKPAPQLKKILYILLPYVCCVCLLASLLLLETITKAICL